ncbi:pyruvate kinase [Methyloversatilis discipulorum]|uniref:pyruvate kinase n=1 Tax=Methyloversatilis discipulorum TaxID=1119528 RepID=UPI0003A060E2|nr:pyruvate kinase [Methyloversatilis discipulorum]
MSTTDKEILCTLGPASLNDRVLARLEELGVNLFRINLSHTKLQDLPRVIDYIRSRTSVPICLDTEGAQIRTGDMLNGEIAVRENSVVHAHKLRVPGDAFNFNLYPEDVIDKLEVGDFISIDFNSVLVQVISRDDAKVTMRVLHGGVIGQNKAVTVERDIPLDTLTAKDIAALEYGRSVGIRHVALSFANRGSDVDQVRALVGDDTFLISKIECRNGLINLDEIAEKSNALLIDRGDLSRQEPIERIPRLQKLIIARGQARKRKVYVATNLLESMITAPKPTRAEVNDVVNTLLDGADGLVLAAETAIGKDPVGCVAMIVKLIREFRVLNERLPAAHKDTLVYTPTDPTSLLIEPHGGVLVNRVSAAAAIDDLAALPRLAVRDTELLDCQQIGVGTFSPLTGFMDRDTLHSVLHRNRLPDGTAWTVPLILQVDEAQARRLSPGQRVVLTDDRGDAHAVLDVTQIYRYDLAELSQLAFGTTSSAHPGVARVLRNGDWFVGGDITLIEERPSPWREFELTPRQSRFIFAHKGWSKVVAFHGRNISHRVHEHLQLEALERTNADGLFINPVVGPKKPGDFLPRPLIRSYQMLIDFGIYPNGKVLLGALATYPRYAGPREAVFNALCRKNIGCSHFIVGRNHAGVGDFYDDRSYRALFDELGDTGVTPVFFDAIGYNPATGAYESGVTDDAHSISGTRVRDSLLRGEPLPDWYVRGIVQDMISAELKAGQPLFHA